MLDDYRKLRAGQGPMRSSAAAVRPHPGNSYRDGAVLSILKFYTIVA